MTVPFIIYALPRSRTAWVSQFLSYRDWECYHESAMFMRSVDDVRAFFTSDKVGCSETAAAQGRHLIRAIAPDIKEVVILRPVDEVVDSLLSIDLSGVATYDKDILRRNMEYGDRELRKIAKDSNVLVIDYADLDKKEVCKLLFEHCLPYKFDNEWWESLKDKNIQVDVKACFMYYHKHREAIENFKRSCKDELRKLVKIGEIKRMKYA